LAWAAEGVAVLEDLLATQRYADVITEADGRLEERPSAVEGRQVRYLKALALMKLQRWDEATAIFAELAGGTDQTAELVALRTADVVLLRGAPEDAAPGYGAFLTKYPQSAYRVQAAFGLAKSYLKAGRWDQAKTQLEAVRSEYPESFEARMSEDLLADGLEFSVQVGSFRRPEFAQDLVDGLRDKGVDAYVKTSQQGEEAFYRVRVGHFRERGPAEVMERQLRGQGFATRLVP
jgi:outer membrane protein assembly factor BamD (BamD/ComL family)